MHDDEGTKVCVNCDRIIVTGNVDGKDEVMVGPGFFFWLRRI
jgi:hypothetical protein